jgi:ferredoxin-nitrate reductase
MHGKERSRPERIADPWGERTPYGRDGAWPVRVDQHLAEGADQGEVDWFISASILHSNGDEIDIAVKDGRIVGVRGDRHSRVNRGRLGPKDLFGWQANLSPDRLTRPLVREDGELRETDWDTALGRVVERSRELLSESGPGAFGFYTSGQLFLEDYYTLSVMARGGRPPGASQRHQPRAAQRPAPAAHRARLDRSRLCRRARGRLREAREHS